MPLRGLSHIEDELASATGTRRVWLLAELAWTLRWDHPERAVNLAHEALDSGAGTEPLLLRARSRAHCVLAGLARLSGDADACQRHALAALEENGADRDVLNRGAAIAFLASAHHQRGQQERARELLVEALESIGPEEPDGRLARLYLLNELGRCCFVLCEWASAHEHFARALELARREGERRMEGVLHVNLGNVLSEIQDSETCLEHYREALDIHRLRADAGGQSLALHNLAVVHARLGDHSEAERCAREALRFAERAGGSAPAPTGLLLAEQLVRRGELAEAREHAALVLERGRESGSSAIVAQALATLASIARQQGDAGLATELLGEALEELEEVEDRTPALQTRVELARAQLAAGHPAEAREAARLAVDEARELAASSFLVSALDALQLACEADGDPAAALEVQREHHRAEVEALRRAADGRTEVLRTQHELDRALQREQDLELRQEELEREVEARTEALRLANAELKEALEDKRRADHEREQLSDQLRQSQKMEAVGRLAGGIAHDFNNLLTVMRGHAELLLDAFPKDSDDRESASHLLDACDRAARLTSQLLAFSRNRPREQKPVSMNALVEDLREMLQRLIGEDVLLELQLTDSATWVEADPGSLEQILLNLVVNARDAMPTGGTLTVSTGRRSHASAVQPAATEHVSVTVSDTGTGIEAELLELIFEPFFTTKPVGEGTGLGLATSYGLVRQAGGTLLVTSTPGAGSTFEVLLPACEAPAAEAALESGASPTRRGAARRVLLVEDEPSVQRLLKSGLESFGHEVTCASDGLEALEAIAADGKGFDVVVSDVVMPRMGGPELLGKLLERGERPPVVLTSGWPDRAGAPPGRAGVDYAFLEKPFRLGSLAEAIESLL